MGRYLVTGGAGYIGSHVTLALLDAGHEVVVLDDLRTGNKRCIVPGAKMVLGSISKTGVLDTAFSTWHFDGIMHLASLSLVGESVQNPAKYFQENINNAITLVEKANRHNVKRIVFSSTAAVYGNHHTSMLTENNTTHPVNPYGESKLIAEKIFEWFYKIYQVKTICLRYFNAAGADAQLRSGEVHDPETHLVPLAIITAKQQTAPLKIFGTDYNTHDGTAIRDYIHVSDIAQAHLSAMNIVDSVGYLCANIGTGQGHSVRDVIKAVESYTGLEVPVEIADRRSGDPEQLIADPSLFKSLTGWSPMHSSLKNIVQTAADWHN